MSFKLAISFIYWPEKDLTSIRLTLIESIVKNFLKKYKISLRKPLLDRKSYQVRGAT